MSEHWPCQMTRTPSAPSDAAASITITTERVDRMSDRIIQDGLMFDDWLRSGGPVLWAHDSRALPVAKATRVRREGRGHRMDFHFLEHDEAQKVHAAYNAGVLAASIGFRSLARVPNEFGGVDHQKCDVTETSLTPTPANVDCVKTLARLGLDAGSAAAVAARSDPRHIHPAYAQARAFDAIHARNAARWQPVLARLAAGAACPDWRDWSVDQLRSMDEPTRAALGIPVGLRP